MRSHEIEAFGFNHDESTLTYRIAFDKFDVDGSGLIDASELQGALMHLGLHYDNEAILGIIRKFDDDGNGQLDLDEFVAMAVAMTQ